MRTKKLLLISFFAFLFWAYFHQASAAPLAGQSSVAGKSPAPLTVAPVISNFAVPGLTVDCAQVVATIKTMRTEYAQGISHVKAHFIELGQVKGAWYANLSTVAGQTVSFPVGYFAPLKESADNITLTSEKMSEWLTDFNEKFSVFTDSYAKCAANKNKKVQIEDALAKFFEMSSEALDITNGLFDYAARQNMQWHKAWSAQEGLDVAIAADQFDVILSLADTMTEAAQLVQDNADLALAELDIITDEGASNGRSSNDRAIQLFYR